MRDCENVEIRDRLPDLLHERLEAGERERVLAHVGTCVDCTDELTLLRTAIAAVTVSRATPRIDSGAIAASVVARLQADRVAQAQTDAPALTLVSDERAISRTPRRSRWSMPLVRAAAAAVVMVLGTTVVVRQRATSPEPARSSAAPVAVATTPTAPAPAAVVESTLASAAPVEPAPRHATTAESGSLAQAALGASFEDLSDDELAAVLDAIEAADTRPAAEPAPTPAVVTSGDLL